MTGGKRVCKGDCEMSTWEHADKVSISRKHPYLNGNKRCKQCDIYINCKKENLFFCPCCGSSLKSKPHDVESKRKFNETVLQVVGY